MEFEGAKLVEELMEKITQAVRTAVARYIKVQSKAYLS